jgi:hypothetical protein
MILERSAAGTRDLSIVIKPPLIAGFLPSLVSGGREQKRPFRNLEHSVIYAGNSRGI